MASEAESKAEGFLARYLDKYSKETIALVKEAYMTAYSHGRYLTNSELYEAYLQIKRKTIHDERILMAAVAGAFTLIGYALGAR